MIKHPLGTTTPWGESCCGCFHWRRVRTSIPGEGESCPQLFLELVPSHFLELSQRGRTWARLWRAAFILGPKGGICELWPWRLETSPTQRSSQKSGNWQQVHHSTTVSDSQSPCHSRMSRRDPELEQRQKQSATVTWGGEEMNFTQGVWEAFLEEGASQLILEMTVY